MRKLNGVAAVVALAVILVVALYNSAQPVQAQATRQVEVKRVNLTRGQDAATTQTLGVPVGISCLSLNSRVECFVASTR